MFLGKDKISNSHKILTIIMWIALCLPSFAFSNKNSKNLNNLESDAFNQFHELLYKTEYSLIKILQEDPNSAFVHYLLSHVYLRYYISNPLSSEGASYAQKAITLAQQAIDIDNTSEFGFLALYDIYQTLGFKESSKILINSPVKSSWRKLYRVILKERESIGLLNSIYLLEDSKFEDANINIIVPVILSLTRELNPNLILASLLRLNKKFSHPLLKQELALYYSNGGKNNESEKIYKRLSKEDFMKYPEIGLNYGTFLVEKSRNYKAAQSILDEILYFEKFPEILKSPTYTQLSLIYLTLNNNLKFKESMTKAIETSENPLETFETIAVQIANKDAKKFRSYAIDFQEQFPGRADFNASIARIYSENLNSKKEAINYYTKAAILDPKNPEYYDALGASYLYLRQFDLAMKFLDFALLLDPNDSIAFYNKACIYAHQNNKELALQNLTQALTLDPSLVQTALNDSDFNNIKDDADFKSLTYSSHSPYFRQDK